MTDALLGFDPGGKGRFGWAVAKDGTSFPPHVHASGSSDNADAALRCALAHLESGDVVRAVGIDAPLTWPQGSNRRADELVRAIVIECGGNGGTVQHINSLQGACIAQGLLVAVAVRSHSPGVVLAESHPKALRLAVDDLAGLFHECEHQRDARLATASAWAALRMPAGWIDLFALADQVHRPIPEPICYPFPVGNRPLQCR